MVDKNVSIRLRGIFLVLLKDIIGIVMEGIVLLLEVGIVDISDSGVHFNFKMLRESKFDWFILGASDIL